MLDTKKLEKQIFACIILEPKILDNIDIDSRYFYYSTFLEYLKTLYKQYKYIDFDLLVNNSNVDKIEEFIISFYDTEISSNNIYGYYKRLKEVYRGNYIIDISEKYKNRQIEFKEFISKMNYINNLDTFDEEEILSIDKVGEFKVAKREYTNIKKLDYLLKGIEYGRISLWSGITNHGKTTLMTQFAKELLKSGKKIFYFSGEQSAIEFKNSLYVGMCKKEDLEFITDSHNSKIYDVKPKKEISERLDDLFRGRLFIYNNNIPQNNITTMIKVMSKAFNQGVRIFFIDNFMQLDNSEKYEEQTKIVESFNRFARNNECIINLVAHPRKTQFQKNRLTIFDISGTQNIANKSSNICTIMRVDLLSDNEKDEIKRLLAYSGYDIDECDAIVEVIKTKGNACKMVGLKYNPDTKTYTEIEEKTKDFIKNNQNRRNYGK